MENNELHRYSKCNSWMVLKNKFLTSLLLGIVLFAFGCKNRGNQSTDFFLTVRGDENVVLRSYEAIKLKKGTEWRNIKQIATSTLVLDRISVKEWRIGDASGEILQDSRVLDSDVTVFAISGDSRHVNINVEIDDGYEYTTAQKRIDARKGAKWGYGSNSVSGEASSLVKPKKGFKAWGFRYGNRNGGYIQEGVTFRKDVTIYATSVAIDVDNRENVSIVVLGDKGFDIGSDSNRFFVDKGAKWGDIKDFALEIANLSEDRGYELKSWHLKNESGEALNDETTFDVATTVFAVSNMPEIPTYQVYHMLENIDNDGYGIASDREVIKGTIGAKTDAKSLEHMKVLVSHFLSNRKL